jgi:hypothetical protein
MHTKELSRCVSPETVGPSDRGMKRRKNRENKAKKEQIEVKKKEVLKNNYS